MLDFCMLDHGLLKYTDSQLCFTVKLALLKTALLYLLISRNPLMLDTGNVLLSYRKSYLGSPMIVLVYRKYLWNVSYAVFTPFQIWQYC